MRAGARSIYGTSAGISGASCSQPRGHGDATYLGNTTKVPCMLGVCLEQMMGYSPGFVAVNVTRVTSPRLTVKESTTPGMVDGCTSPFTPTISRITVSPCRTTIVPGDHW